MTDGKTYCDKCNGEDLATICKWCHNRLMKEQAKKIFRELEDIPEAYWYALKEFIVPLRKKYTE